MWSGDKQCSYTQCWVLLRSTAVWPERDRRLPRSREGNGLAKATQVQLCSWATSSTARSKQGRTLMFVRSQHTLSWVICSECSNYCWDKRHRSCRKQLTRNRRAGRIRGSSGKSFGQKRKEEEGISETPAEESGHSAGTLTHPTDGN